MATKRTKKKATRKTARKRTAPRKRAKPRKQSGLLKNTFVLGLLIVIGLVVILALSYRFSSYTVRGRMERIALVSVDTLRAPEWMPALITDSLDWMHDCIPNNEGMVVDGGELGYDESVFIAGKPSSKKRLRTLENRSSINLFDSSMRQTACIAVRLTADSDGEAPTPTANFEDPRVPDLKAKHLGMGDWQATPIIPAAALAKEFGPSGANEAHLNSQLVPMRRSLASGRWQELMQLLSEDYPARFGEIRLYAGPAYRKQYAKLASGIPAPDGYYAIAFHITDSGGLRAIAFLLPHDRECEKLRDCITSIAQIEEVSGINFLPELDYDARESLRNWISPGLW